MCALSEAGVIFYCCDHTSVLSQSWGMKVLWLELTRAPHSWHNHSMLWFLSITRVVMEVSVPSEPAYWVCSNMQDRSHSTSNSSRRNLVCWSQSGNNNGSGSNGKIWTAVSNQVEICTEVCDEFPTPPQSSYCHMGTRTFRFSIPRIDPSRIEKSQKSRWFIGCPRSE